MIRRQTLARMVSDDGAAPPRTYERLALAERLRPPRAIAPLRAARLGLPPARDVAIALIGANRPDALDQVARSLRNNPEVERTPVFAFIDRASRKDQRALRQVLEALDFPLLYIVERPFQLGCGRNIIDARRQLFDHLGYERVFVFEDDLVVGDRYLALCQKLLAWAQTHYADVGVVQAWHPCRADTKEKRRRRGHVVATFENLWGYLMTRRCWEDIRDVMGRFEHYFLRHPDYAARNAPLIRGWQRSLLSRADPRTPGTSQLPPWPRDRAYRRAASALVSQIPAGQDSVTMTAMGVAGWVRVATEVNRAIYIGERGIHMNPTRFREEFGYHRVVLDDMGDDALDTFHTEPSDGPPGLKHPPHRSAAR